MIAVFMWTFSDLIAWIAIGIILVLLFIGGIMYLWGCFLDWIDGLRAKWRARRQVKK